MKIEWGKKIHCPACALPFYTMQKTELVCPNCGHSFDIMELVTRKMEEPLDIMPEDDEQLVLSGFGYDESPEDELEIAEDAGLEDKTMLGDIKLVDED